MDELLQELSAALGQLGLSDLPVEEEGIYESWTATEDIASLRSIAGANVIDIDGGGNVADGDALHEAMATASALIARWLSEYTSLHASGAQTTDGDELLLATVADEAAISKQVNAKSTFWEAVSGVTAKACKALVMLAHKAFVSFMSAPATVSLHESTVASDALQAIQLYWTILRVPGANSYGLFDSSVVRRSLAVSKRYLELAVASGPASNCRVKPSAAAAPKPAKRGRPAASDPAPEGVRRNPKRSASAAAAADDDDDMDEDEEENDSGAGAVGKGRGRSGRRGSASSSAAPEGSDTAIRFSTANVATLRGLLAAMQSFLADFSLRSYQEFIPQAVDVLALALTLPLHVVPAAVPGEHCDLDPHSAADPLVIAASCLLALLNPCHASPLTTARIVLKKLKPFMLHGHAGTASAASGLHGAAAAAVAAMQEEMQAANGGDDDDDGGFGRVLDITKPVAPPDPRVVRARALYLTRVLVSDKLSGRVTASRADADPDAVEAIPNQVLVRLPAVTALLQHLAAGAVTAKADVRSITCDIIAHLRACLPHSLRRSMVRFLWKFGRASKVGYRLLAVEIAGRLLGANEGSQRGNGAAGVSETSAFDLGKELGEGDEASSSSSAAAAGSGGPRNTNSRSSGPEVSPILTIALAEMPRPSQADKKLESEGYGQDGYDYAGVENEENAEDAGDGGAGAGAASPGGSVSTGRTGSQRNRRRSIVLMGSDNAQTPMRAGGAAGQNTPGAKSTGGRSRGPGSPFYGRRGSVHMGAMSVRSGEGEQEEDIDGCCDPRPTVTILLDVLYHRSSDKSPAVRAKAIAMLAAAVDPPQNRHARLLALMLTHIAHTSALVALAAGGGVSDVTMGDVTMAGLNSNAAIAAAALTASAGPSSSANVPLPPGVQAYAPAGPSPLVPLFVRRMADPKPAVRKAAVQAATSLALARGTDILYAAALVTGSISSSDVQIIDDDDAADDGGDGAGAGAATSQAAAEGAGVGAGLSWASAVAMHKQVYDAAKLIATAAAADAASGDDAGASSTAVSSVLGLWCLQTICSKATDASIIVRKTTMTCIHSMLTAEPSTPAMQQLWLATVLPLVADTEQSVSSKAVECTREAIVDGLLDWHAAVLMKEKLKASKKAGAADEADAIVIPTLPWQLLDGASSNDDLSKCVALAISNMAKAATAVPSSAAASGSAQASFPLERLVAALQAAASATEVKTYDLKEGGLITAALDADTTMVPAAGSDGMDLEGDAAASSSAAAASSAGSVGKVTAATYRRAAWLLLEILAGHYASKAISGGGMSIAVAASLPLIAAFNPVLPFLIRSWGTMMKALKSQHSHATGTNTTIDNNATSVAVSAAGNVEELHSGAARVVRILTLLSPGLKAQDATGLVASVVAGLRWFTWEPSLVSAGVRMAATASASHSDSQTGMRKATEAWSGPIVSAAADVLQQAIMKPERMDCDQVCTVLFSLGECAMIALDADAGQGVADAGSTAASSAASGGADSVDDTKKGKGKKDASADATRRLVPVDISERIVTLVQALLAPTLMSTSSSASGGAGAGAASSSSASTVTKVPDSVRAHAYLALGKMCLRDNGLAKRFVPVLVRDLMPNGPAAPPPAVRNNILFVLGDMCIRYTAMVDRHFTAMAEALADPTPFIRRHALMLLTQLVTSDYLKWRGHLFYRFAAALADSDENVRTTAQAAITGALISKNRLLLQSHFVDLVFVLTGCTTHPAYQHLVNIGGKAGDDAKAKRASKPVEAATAALMEDGDDEHAAGSASGSSAAAPSAEGNVLKALVMPEALRRMHVYRTLLHAMPEEQRFTVHSKLAIEVLGGLLEGTLHLTPRDKLAAMMNQAPSKMQALTPQAASRLPSASGEDEQDGDETVDAATSANTAVNSGGSVWFPLGSTEALVAEVFAILSSPDMRMGSSANAGGNKKGGDDGDDDVGIGDDGDAEAANAVMSQTLAQAKSKLMAKLARKQVVEHVVPICIGLKHLFTTAKSPLTGPLMGYLASLFHDYGEDVKEVLSSDRQTAAELEFDLRMYNQGQLDAYGQPIQNSAGSSMTDGPGAGAASSASAVVVGAGAGAGAAGVRSTGKPGGWIGRAATPGAIAAATPVGHGRRSASMNPPPSASSASSGGTGSAPNTPSRVSGGQRAPMSPVPPSLKKHAGAGAAGAGSMQASPQASSSSSSRPVAMGSPSIKRLAAMAGADEPAGTSKNSKKASAAAAGAGGSKKGFAEPLEDEDDDGSRAGEAVMVDVEGVVASGAASKSKGRQQGKGKQQPASSSSSDVWNVDLELEESSAAAVAGTKKGKGGKAAESSSAASPSAQAAASASVGEADVKGKKRSRPGSAGK